MRIGCAPGCAFSSSARFNLFDVSRTDLPVSNGSSTTFGVQATLSNSLLLSNVAQGGAGAAGGNGLGGGIYNDGPVGPFAASQVTLDDTLVFFNEAEGGAASAGGAQGEGVGGGIYNLGTLNSAMAQIKHNEASTSNNDIFGTVNLF